MSQKNCTRSGCKDVFHAFMVQNASYEGTLEMPKIALEPTLPSKMIPFSKAISGTDFEAWVHFYEDDAAFERLWNAPRKYLPILKRYKGVIAPDFSLYRDMPLVMQQWNIYRSHAVAVWLRRSDSRQCALGGCADLRRMLRRRPQTGRHRSWVPRLHKTSTGS